MDFTNIIYTGCREVLDMVDKQRTKKRVEKAYLLDIFIHII